jgi:predicted ester cyclase
MQVAEGDLIGTRATLRGTHQDAFFGFAPTGKAIAWDFFSLARVVDGAVVEHNGSADWTAALVELGLLMP